tara:strand:- start:1154 stop:1636 length:483 start_codon:yes stop_codon:yes gene_type:complete
MSNPFQIAWSFLKAETPGRDAMMEAMSNNMTKPDKYGNTRQMKRTPRWGDASGAQAGRIVNAQERMRTGPVNDPNDNTPFGEEGDESYDMRPTEERPISNESDNRPIGGESEDPRSDRSALRFLASQLGMQHKDVPYPIPPEMFEQMATEYQMMNQDTYD